MMKTNNEVSEVSFMKSWFVVCIQIYDDLRPPTSSSPNAPSGSIPPPLSTVVNNIAQALPAEKLVEEQRHDVTKPRPLSPFAMYEDLKPPTSPCPTPRML
ncbi:protein TIC 62, chloroplastic-like [Rhododendron vialii]|uniref:protein TIC 62, chloroplastic-like n=1 Tax=Rhododendron vialii TaxID=182163 RepID=UPI00265EC254|nr:protein TIC 62, chloroplastic-like [Rhododendron vialii]